MRAPGSAFAAIANRSSIAYTSGFASAGVPLVPWNACGNAAGGDSFDIPRSFRKPAWLYLPGPGILSMVDFNLINSLGDIDADVDAAVATALGDAAQDITKLVSGEEVQDFTPGAIIKGKVSGVVGDDFVVELGLKSEGVLDKTEFDDPDTVKVGDVVHVLLEDVEGDTGLVKISKRKADRIINWEAIMKAKKEGDAVKGKVTKKIKGGLLVDIGVPVFLPASQVDIRRPGEISDWIGREIDAVILKIDEERRNIVISRRKMIEQQREEQKKRTLESVEVGAIVKGTVKNIADFGAFIDLGGIDGLLHITDMSWGRINHPSDILKIDQEIEVKVLQIDREKEKIALGLKQKEPSPWENIEAKYPVGSVHDAEVVNIMSYGAFCKLEAGVEGLVHISEMSWTKRINHPSEVVAAGQTVKVKVLEINKDKQEISLGMKQVEENPWERVAEKYPQGSVVEGKVRNIANYGAFIEIEEGIDGLLHVSDLSWTKKIGHPSEILKKGESVKAVVLNVDQEKQRIALGLKQLQEDPWQTVIPANYRPGMVVKGHVTKIANFGVFVELEPGLEGLLHISEISDQKIEKPEEALKAGQEVEVKILRVDSDERKIGLSLKRAQWAAEEQQRETEREQRAVKRGLRGGLEGGEESHGLGDLKLGE
ncbi:MAG TPA: 30S ribosomal protein S1 [Tepidisphaeraceae bacterium]|nr:30S ribosomal protein S1 [Tepidisphaeraceae bacterium]